ncbi:hypothetical protein XELAEV_18029622mg [Xenopus laevis]|uniref:Ig-like domain-containing protein n=1 Tax=Xenopus laevis TaxID=8355 RepID=A0A974CRU8_XENLA|nr:hypothetical protein XELAEV_18029622mg [Xenopus laevis]
MTYSPALSASLMSVERVFLIISSICVITILGHAPPGRTAVFICNISALNYDPTDINWSKTYNNNTSKIADLTSLKDTNRIHIKTNWTFRIAELHIRNLTVNDSGEYHCEHLNVTANSKIMLSNRSRLNVTGDKEIAMAVTKSATQNSMNKITEKVAVVISASVVFILLLLLCASLLLWHKKRNKTPQTHLKHLVASQGAEYSAILAQHIQEKPPQDPEAFTVDYGVLAFPNNSPYRKSAELCTLEQVEYATIMFPQGTPSMGERRGKDAACNHSPRVCRD